MQAVRTRALSKTYRTGKQEVPVLYGLDLDIAKGEFLSIMGPSGSGKSTLMNLLGLLDTPTSGSIHIMDRDASRLDRNQRAKARRYAMGFVFQAFHLLPRTSAIQNVMLPLALAGTPRRQRKPRAMELLDSVGLSDRANFKPSELSGGQKQRVAIARALALDPPIVFADEPTGNLDSETSGQVMELFQSLHQQGRTIIQVTHDIHMARFGDRVIHLGDGRILRDERRPR